MPGIQKIRKKFAWRIPSIRNGATEQNLYMAVKRSNNFLPAKGQIELGYKLKKELWGFRENRMAVRFEYEWHDETNQWYRSYGNELWEFDENGLMRKRYASINDLPITDEERKFK